MHAVYVCYTVLISSLLFFLCSVTFLSSAYNTQTLQNNSIYPDLLPEEMDMLYSAYGDETGVQCALRCAVNIYNLYISLIGIIYGINVCL